MQKSTYILMALALLTAVALAACGGAPAPTEPPPPPPVESAPTEAPPPAAVEPTQAVEPAPAFAPACPESASCTAPEIQDKPAFETYCVQKVPYQNLMLPAGTILEPQPKAGDPEFYPLVCADSGTKVSGLNVFSCRGAELWSYDLKVTNPACGGGGNLQTGTTQCQEGLGYDAANNCCAPISGGGGGSVVIKVNMGACPTQNK
jgi:hypothetical protein